ncbi:phosphatases II [Thelephora ganbajun]|uniref:Phosphatases II n=1 Tax=Thelephora ganbajun TaxID=370292 RepID=A0ACB6ZDX6_THEGA|nr:phosphatases II [Thelephora ganbajun]
MATSTLPRPTLPVAQHRIDILLPQQQQHTSINAILKRPIPNSYWATSLLLACEYPWCPGVANQKIEALLAAGVRTFIDLTEVNELRAYGSYLSARAEAMGLTDIEYHRFPIVDRSLPESVEYMRSILKVPKDNEQRGRIVAVHCRGGIGRTGMVIGCWLVESGIARDGDEALRMISKEWQTVEKCRRFPHSPETGPQFEFVRSYKRLPGR